MDTPEQMHALATAVAKELGADWTPDPAYSLTRTDAPDHYRATHARLNGPDSVRVLLIDGSFPGIIRPYRPGRLKLIADGGSGASDYSVTIAANAGPERIARTIAQRLLPAALPGIRAQRERQAAEQRAADADRDLLDDLADLAGTARASRQYIYDPHIYGPGCTGQIRVDGQRVTFKYLTVSPETARRLIDVLKTAEEG